MSAQRLSYQQLVRKLERLSHLPGLSLQRIGQQVILHKGTNPQLLLTSGLHGDELGVHVSLLRLLPQLAHSLPDFCYIPYASPSACQAGTRHTPEGIDLNRSFTSKATHPEALFLQEWLDQKKFKQLISLHQDNDNDQVYIYESAHQPSISLVANWQQQVTRHGWQLFTGVDDPQDPALGHHIQDGYFYTNGTSSCFEDWCRDTRVSQQSLTLEVGGFLPQSTKDTVVAVSLQSLVNV